MLAVEPGLLGPFISFYERWKDSTSLPYESLIPSSHYPAVADEGRKGVRGGGRLAQWRSSLESWDRFRGRSSKSWPTPTRGWATGSGWGGVTLSGLSQGTNHRTPTQAWSTFGGPASAVGVFFWMVETPWVAKVCNWQRDPVVKPCGSHLHELHRKLEAVQRRVIITREEILAQPHNRQTGRTEEAKQLSEHFETTDRTAVRFTHKWGWETLWPLHSYRQVC